MARPTRARDRLVRVTALTAALCAALLPLGGCLGTDAVRRRPIPQADLSPPADLPQAPAAPNPATPATPAAFAGQRIGTGTVKVALVLPLNGQGAAVGNALRNAAQLAY